MRGEIKMNNDTDVVISEPVTNRSRNTHNRLWYDTEEGILASLCSLDAFNALLDERRKAGYKRKERMNEFYVLGRYFLDTCGNCMKIFGWVPKENFPKLPDVMSSYAFWQFMDLACAEKCWITTQPGEVPDSKVTCPICKKGWDIHSCHNSVIIQKNEVFSLQDFVGKTLREVMSFYTAKNDARYSMYHEILIRNDRFIDLSPKYPDPKDSYQKGVVKNEKGWVGSVEGVGDDYVIEVGDEGYFYVWKYYHSLCRRLYLVSMEETFFRDVFAKAGFMFSIMHHLPNGYTNEKSSPPWFKVETEIGCITIGQRKRVISIEWGETFHSEKEILSMFQSENVTKSDTLIHAWGKEKAIEYLSKIREALI